MRDDTPNSTLDDRTETTMIRHTRGGGTRGVLGRMTGWTLALAVVALSAGACDTEVTNPGPAQDEFLNRPAAFEAVVNGANRAFNDAWNEVARVLASGTREIFPSGNTGNFGISTSERQGLYLVDEQDLQWDEAQNARWVAEDAIRRFQEVLDDGEFSSNEDVAEAYLWAGYANRLLGENFCEAVIDGGDIEPHTVFFQRAETHFQNAMQVASSAGNQTLALAAQGGRASVRMNMGDWAGAVSDAEAVLAADPGFNFQTAMSAASTDQYNSIFYASQNQPYRVHTVWNTFYEDYYTETNDPRTPWITDPDFPEGSFGIGPFGTVPWLAQRKHDARDDGVDMTDAREMHLILAEAALVDGDWETAMDIINNDIRATVPGADLDPWEASSLEEAWTAFMRERGIELWLEGRRAGDRRRWAVSDDQPWELAVPGELDVHEVPSETEPEHERGAGTYLASNSTVCIPVPDSERETNPNVPITGG